MRKTIRVEIRGCQTLWNLDCLQVQFSSQNNKLRHYAPQELSALKTVQAVFPTGEGEPHHHGKV
jgi:hypothetical protein